MPFPCLGTALGGKLCFDELSLASPEKNDLKGTRPMRVQEASEKVITVHEAWEMKGRTREYKV